MHDEFDSSTVATMRRFSENLLVPAHDILSKFPTLRQFVQAVFDSSSVENMRRLSEVVRVPAHIHALSLLCFEIMPPPVQVGSLTLTLTIMVFLNEVYLAEKLCVSRTCLRSNKSFVAIVCCRWKRS